MTIAADRGSTVYLQPNLKDPYYSILFDFLEEKFSPDEACLSLLEMIEKQTFTDPLSHLEGYRKLLTLSILCKIIKGSYDYFYPIQSLLEEKLSSIQTWKEFQLISAYTSLISKLSTHNKKNDLQVKVDTDGFAPLEYGRHWSWADTPLQPYHIELGLITALLGQQTKRYELIAIADKIATFQKNILDEDYLPFPGIFTQEKDAISSDLIGWAASLFYALGHSLQNNDHLSICESQLQYLLKENMKVHPLISMISRWKPFALMLNTMHKPKLPESFKSITTGSCGRRKKFATSISTLYGGRTGLGTFHVNRNLAFVTFGPQYHPYGDCQGFGVESNASLQSKFPSVSIEEKNGNYLLKGYTKLPGKAPHKTPYSIWGNTSHSEIWLDVKQELTDAGLDLQINYLSYRTIEPLSFVFYVKAGECRIDGVQTLKPKSLDRYQGNVGKLTFSSETKQISLSPEFDQSRMEVIPLAGDDSFWGCDFLVGFTVQQEEPSHRWKITT